MIDKGSSEGGLLGGLRVAVFGGLPAGIIAGSMLADLGAEVVRLDSPRNDFSQPDRPPVIGESSLAWSIIARSTLSATIDLASSMGAKLARQLLDHVDLVVESMGPQKFERVGLDPASLAPSLVVVRISGYGQTGPYCDLPADDLTTLAYSGLAHLTGHRGGAPVALASAIADYLCAVSATQAGVAALFDRLETGRGDVIDAPLYGAALRITEWAIPAADRLGTNRTREGNFPRNAAPLGVYPTKDDQFVAVVGGADANFGRLVEAMQEPAIADPRFSNPSQRSEQADELNEMVRTWTARFTIEELESRCMASGVPFGRVYTARDLSSDPHFVARHDFVEVGDPPFGRVTQAAPYPLVSNSTPKETTAARTLGADNPYVWCQLVGLSDREFQDALAIGSI